MTLAHPPVVSQTEWDAALAATLEREKAVGAAMHELAAERIGWSDVPWYTIGSEPFSRTSAPDAAVLAPEAYPRLLDRACPQR
jgi:predicted dithiol-disulfide oxidoreductase (DUF899 family)